LGVFKFIPFAKPLLVGGQFLVYTRVLGSKFCNLGREMGHNIGFTYGVSLICGDYRGGYTLRPKFYKVSTLGVTQRSALETKVGEPL